jgi:hypothetical protein
MRILASTAACFAFVLAAPSVFADPAKPPAEPPSPGFERLLSLAGEWAGTASGSGDMRNMPTKASIRVASAGSAVVLTTDPGTPHEMVTVFHRDDGGVLVAKHYCAARNQPRMKATPGSDVSRITFDFVDGTNLGAYPGRMQRLVILTPSPDRQIQEWTYRAGGKDSTDTFDLKRGP